MKPHRTLEPVRWSNLRYMADCPAMYKYMLDNPPEPTPAMRFGSLVHAMVLGKAPTSFVVYDGQRRGNAWKDFKAEHTGVEIVTAEEWERASACSDAVKADPVAAPLLESGMREHQISWLIGDRECSGRLDNIGSTLSDIKVTQMVKPERFPWHAKKMLWHAGMAWYKNGAIENGNWIDQVCIIAVTPKQPYIVVVYKLTEDTLTLGHRQWRLLFERLRTCEESNEWPGYVQDIIPLDIPDDELTLTIDGEEVEL